MSKWKMFLQNLFFYVRETRGIILKKRHRMAAALTAGALVFSLFDFIPVGYGGKEKDAMAAYRQISPGDMENLEYRSTNSEEIVETLETEQMAASMQLKIVQKQKISSKEEVIAEEERAMSGIEGVKTGERLEKSSNGEVKTGERLEKSSRSEGETEGKQDVEEESFYSDTDYQVLLNIVQAEAGNCDAIGKILVANVILNRVKSEKFPDTIKGVVYEKSQFSPVINGSINRVEVSESTRDCVSRALNGEDYSQGALYFMNRRASQSGNVSWFDQKLTYLFQHEKHEFFK